VTKQVLGERELNALELLWGGLLDSYPTDTPGAGAGQNNVPVTFIDSEGTPIAELDSERGTVARLRPLGRRPFSELRMVRPNQISEAVLVITGDVPQGLEPLSRTIVVLDDGDHGRLARRVQAARVLQAPVRVLPLPPEAAGEEWTRETIKRLLLRAGAIDITTVETGIADTGGLVIFLTGLSGSGKSTIARALAERLRDTDLRPVTLLDGDEVRAMLSAELGFDRLGRELNVRRIAWVASLVARYGGIAVCAPIAPYASMRADARRQASDVGARFMLVHVSTPLAVCEARDRKGLYAQARAGTLQGFTGIDDPYEPPDDADADIDTSILSVDDAVAIIESAIHHDTVDSLLHPRGSFRDDTSPDMQ